MSEGRRRIRRVAHEEVGLQIAPMIDVTLLLLFFFMLAGKITKAEKMMDIKVPVAATGKIPEDEGNRDIVNIDSQGQLFSGSKPMTTKELSVHLKQRFKDYPPLKLYVRADAGTPGKRIKEIMAMASEAGAIEVIFGVIQK
ncbi:MAG: Biopolymer transport protein ExbD [Verrucomicrobiota bacterium]|jgi:biopolymer transport protein ExbD